MTTIDSTTDLLPLFRATREQGEIVEIEIHASVEESVREQLLADCEGRDKDADTYLFFGQDADGEDVTWTVQVVDVFGTAPGAPAPARIAALADEAGASGDILMAAICRRALGEGYSDYALTDAERRRVDAMTQDEALAEVHEALSSADAMAA